MINVECHYKIENDCERLFDECNSAILRKSEDQFVEEQKRSLQYGILYCWYEYHNGTIQNQGDLSGVLL